VRKHVLVWDLDIWASEFGESGPLVLWKSTIGCDWGSEWLAQAIDGAGCLESTTERSLSQIPTMRGPLPVEAQQTLSWPMMPPATIVRAVLTLTYLKEWLGKGTGSYWVLSYQNKVYTEWVYVGTYRIKFWKRVSILLVGSDFCKFTGVCYAMRKIECTIIAWE